MPCGVEFWSEPASLLRLPQTFGREGNETNASFDVKIGMHCGSVVANLVGTKRKQMAIIGYVTRTLHQ